MELGLFQQQKMSLVMTQSLKQAIHLLQYSATDVMAYLEEQALENPLLEVVPLKETKRDDYIGQVTVSSDQKHAALENTARSYTTLYEALRFQVLDLAGVTKEEKKHLHYLIDCLQEDGYFRDDLADICEKRGLTLVDGEHLLALIQSLEPAGVGARSLGECLALQLVRIPDCDPLAPEIVRIHLECLAERKWRQLAQQFSVDIDRIQTIYDCVKTLHPKPGACFATEPTVYTVPDVYIMKEENELLVAMNQTVLPTVRIQEEYRRLLFTNGETKAYAKEKAQHIEWLKKSLTYRTQTIERVVEMIARHQRHYLLHPQGQLRPLTLANVAEALDLHESTVSRATANKVVQTPRGTFWLKHFFTSNINKTSGMVTQQSVKQWLRETIAKEDRYQPLSDQSLTELLQEERGMTLSRRVVAKYRTELGILSSAKRRRYAERLVQ
ncbi:RNA polymerase factor sigma-54 [Bacillus sp. FSL W7-1360]